jgi:hypothetical protein
MNVSRDHTITVSFIKNGEEPVPNTLGNVQFIGVKQSHTIQVFFGFYIPTPEPIEDHTKLLLNFDEPVLYTPISAQAELNIPWSGVFSSVDSSNWNHEITVAKVGGIGQTSEYLSGLISTAKMVAGNSSAHFENMGGGGFYMNQIPGCKIGTGDWTIDWWWTFEFEININFPNKIGPYLPGLTSGFGASFFNLRDDSYTNVDGSANQNGEVNTLAGQLEQKAGIPIVLESGIADANESYETLIDTSKSWEVNSLVNKFLVITSGPGSNHVLSSPDTPQRIVSNTANSITVYFSADFSTFPNPTIYFGIKEYLTEESHYEIQEINYIYHMQLTYDNRRDFSSGSPVYDGIWPFELFTEYEQHHIAFVRYNGNIKCYVDGTALTQSTQIPFSFTESSQYNWMLSGGITDTFKGWTDIFRVTDLALFTEDFAPRYQSVDHIINFSNLVVLDTDFTPPSTPFIEVNPEFDSTMTLEVVIRASGEFDILLDSELALELIREILIPSTTFNSNMSLYTFNQLIEVQRDFVFSNKWKREMFDTYSHVPGVEGDYRIALMNRFFVFDPDTHERFIDQIDSYEIEEQNGYESGLPLLFNDFSLDGILSFNDFELSVGKLESISSLVIYDYSTDVKGLIVGCLSLEHSMLFDESMIKLSDLSFQII